MQGCQVRVVHAWAGVEDMRNPGSQQARSESKAGTSQPGTDRHTFRCRSNKKRARSNSCFECNIRRNRLYSYTVASAHTQRNRGSPNGSVSFHHHHHLSSPQLRYCYIVPAVSHLKSPREELKSLSSLPTRERRIKTHTRSQKNKS
jgi:hypothetical protein